MASFVETATLRIDDKESMRAIKRLNNALNTLFKPRKATFAGNVTRDLEKAAKAAQALKGIRFPSPTNSAVSRLNSYASALERAGRAASGLGGARFPTAPLGRQATGTVGAPRANRVNIRSGGGFGIPGLPIGFGVSGPGLSIGAATLTVGAMTATVRSLVVQGAQLERAQQSVVATATREQFGAVRALQGPENLPVSDVEFQRLATSFLADTAGNVEAASALALRTMQSAAQRAQANGITFNQALDEVGNSLVKAVGQVTTEMVDENGRLTKRAIESFNTFDSVLRAQPTLSPRDIAQIAAGIGPARTTVDQETLFRTLFLGGDFGTKLGNQLRQAIEGLQGNQREKSNVALAAIGIDANDPRIATDAANFFVDTLFPAVEKQVNAFFARQGITPTEEQRRARFNQELIPIFGRQTARNIIAEFYSSMQALNRASEQAAKLQAEAAEKQLAFMNSWVNQLDVSTKRVTTLMGQLGDALGTSLLPAIKAFGSAAEGISDFITNPQTGEVIPGRAAAVGGAGIVAALAAAKGATNLVNKMFNPLNGAATALTGSAGQLTRAALALQGAAGVGGAVPGLPGGKGAGPRVGLPASGLGGIGTFMGAVGMFQIAVSEFKRQQEVSEKGAVNVATEVANANEKAAAETNRSVESFMDNTLGKAITDILITRQSEIDKQDQERLQRNEALRSEAQNKIASEQAALSVLKLQREMLPENKNPFAFSPEEQKISFAINALQQSVDGLANTISVLRPGGVLEDLQKSEPLALDVPLPGTKPTQDALATIFGMGAETFTNVFSMGVGDLSGTFENGVAAIGASAPAFGEAAGAGMVNFASQFGAAAAAAFNANANVQATVTVQQPNNVDTGASAPN